MTSSKSSRPSDTILAGRAKKMVDEKCAHSVVLAQPQIRFPKLQLSDLSLGRVLGRGSYCVITEVRVAPKNPSHPLLASTSQRDTFLLRHRFAMKKLHGNFSDEDVKTNASKVDALYCGVADLALEARFLSSLSHPNIIRLYAQSTASPYQPQYFMVLDRLYDILSFRISQKWKKQKPGTFKRLVRHTATDRRQGVHWLERVSVAYKVASALAYLHSVHILYRDLKTANVGFDYQDEVKIFDFGLAKAVDPKQRDSKGNFLLTGFTGSPLYMAPEVALGRPYNESIDVYSFGMLFWHILQLEVPFKGYTMNMIRERVVLGGWRPRCGSDWPDSICNLLHETWDNNPRVRPSMKEVAERLYNEIASSF